MALHIASSTALTPQSFGRCQRTTNRVERSGGIPTALALALPIMRSPPSDQELRALLLRRDDHRS